MSLAEIKDEVRRLSREEREELARFILELCGPDETETRRALDAVFEKHRELFQRLAQ